MSSAERSAEIKTRRFYGRRKGPALTARRQALLDDLLPRLAIDAGAARLDPDTLFDPPPAQIWLEIGFGKGEHLAWQAERNPDIGLLGCEPFLNGVAGLLADIDARGLRNVRIWPDDARDLLDRLPDGSIDRLFLLHPDPWPKTRHASRRFIQPDNLDALARVLKPGAAVRIATDDPVFRQWTLVHMAQRRDFAWSATRPADWRTPPADWIETRYARKAQAEGRAPVYLIYHRC
ncbi:MAG: tRNA (guanine(46)-N(7))-methyltransferase TrmB [Rhodothalassiaceae bacterium]